MDLGAIVGVIFWATILVVVFFLAVVIWPNIGHRVFRRPLSRIFAFHLAVQIALLGVGIFMGLLLVFGRTSCGEFEGPCHSYIGQELLGGLIMLVGFPGVIWTWRRSRWLVIWDWLLVAAAGGWFLQMATSDLLLSLSILAPLAIFLYLALTTQKILRGQSPAKI